MKGSSRDGPRQKQMEKDYQAMTPFFHFFCVQVLQLIYSYTEWCCNLKVFVSCILLLTAVGHSKPLIRTERSMASLSQLPSLRVMVELQNVYPCATDILSAWTTVPKLFSLL